MAGQAVARPRQQRLSNLEIEDAKIFFRNFAGKEGMYNREGDRNFCVALDPDVAEAMEQDGWNVKWTKVREEGDVPEPYMQVSVSYKHRPPIVVMITSRGRTNVPEDMVEVLDWVDISKVDLVINPYRWAVKESTGIKAYLHAIYITIQENRFEKKYADIPEISFNAPLEIEAGPGDDILEGEVLD